MFFNIASFRIRIQADTENTDDTNGLLFHTVYTVDLKDLQKQLFGTSEEHTTTTTTTTVAKAAVGAQDPSTYSRASSQILCGEIT